MGLGAGVNIAGQATGGAATGNTNPRATGNLDNNNNNNRQPAANRRPGNVAGGTNAAGAATPTTRTGASIENPFGGVNAGTLGTSSAAASATGAGATATSVSTQFNNSSVMQQFNVSFGVGGNGLRVDALGAGLARQAGLQVGDQIVSINGTAVTGEAELATVLGQLGSSPLMIGIQRNGQFRMLQGGVFAAGVGAAPVAGTSFAGATGVPPTTGFGQAGVAGTAAASPFAGVELTGNFSTDFDRWGTDFTTALTTQQNQIQAQIAQLSQLNARVNALRTGIMTGTGNSADNVHMLEQLRRLRNDVTMLASQSSGDFRVHLNALNDRLTLLQPTPAAASGSASAGVTAGELGTSAATAGERGNSAATAGETGAVPRTITPR
jgi:hypothetical protein